MYAIQRTSDGGYILVGNTVSYGAGKLDFLVLKLDSSGNIEWQKVIDGSENDFVRSVRQMTDVGYVIAGQTQSVTQFVAYAWLVKLDASGNIVLQKTYSNAGGQSFHISNPSEIWCIRKHVDNLFVDSTLSLT